MYARSSAFSLLSKLARFRALPSATRASGRQKMSEPNS